MLLVTKILHFFLILLWFIWQNTFNNRLLWFDGLVTWWPDGNGFQALSGWNVHALLGLGTSGVSGCWRPLVGEHTRGRTGLQPTSYFFNFCFCRSRPRFAPFSQRFFLFLQGNKRRTGLRSRTCPFILGVTLSWAGRARRSWFFCFFFLPFFPFYFLSFFLCCSTKRVSQDGYASKQTPDRKET